MHKREFHLLVTLVSWKTMHSHRKPPVDKHCNYALPLTTMQVCVMCPTACLFVGVQLASTQDVLENKDSLCSDNYSLQKSLSMHTEIDEISRDVDRPCALRSANSL